MRVIRAVAKTYEYRIFREAICPPFLARYVYACPWALDLEALEACARLFEGEHDFRALPRPTQSGASGLQLWTGSRLKERRCTELTVAQRLEQTTIRTIFSSAWEQRQTEAGELLLYRVRGNGFLHHMVRNLAGTMIDVGRGQLALEAISGILAARNRSAAGPTAPARGLFLHSVEYDERDLMLKDARRIASDLSIGPRHAPIENAQNGTVEGAE